MGRCGEDMSPDATGHVQDSAPGCPQCVGRRRAWVPLVVQEYPCCEPPPGLVRTGWAVLLQLAGGGPTDGELALVQAKREESRICQGPHSPSLPAPHPEPPTRPSSGPLIGFFIDSPPKENTF